MTTNAWLAAPRSQTTAEHNAEAVAEAAFDTLFLDHYSGIFRLVCRIVGDRDEAEDLVQETFLRLHATPRLWQTRPASGETHNVRAWLYRVATNLAYNALRARGRRDRRHAAVMDPEALAGKDAPDPLTTALRDDERTTVRRVLAELPERQAKLLLLRHAGLSYRELARVVGVAPGSVGTLLARAGAAFEKSYRALTPDEGGQDAL